MDNGFKIYLLFFLWLGIVTGIPNLFYHSEESALLGVTAIGVGIAAMAMSGQIEGFSFWKKYPVTYGHFWMFLVYAVGGIFMIGFRDMEYGDMRALGKCILFYTAYPVIAFVIEYWIKTRKEKKFASTLAVGQLYEEAGSRESLPYWSHEKNLEIIRNSIWVIKEINDVGDIILQDAHCLRRRKKVTSEELAQYKRIQWMWYRDPWCYENLIEEIKKRASEEIYDPDECGDGDII